MAGNPNTLIVLGSSLDSYFISYGRRHFVENMSESFIAPTDRPEYLHDIVDKVRIKAIAPFPRLTQYIVHFNRSILPDVRDHLTDTNSKAAADFVTFPDSDNPTHYFIKGKKQGAWSAMLQNYFIQELNKMKADVRNFDAGITGMLFGKGKTHIYLFRVGFLADFDDEIDSLEHPLYKVYIVDLLDSSPKLISHTCVQILVQYSKGWCIERGLTQCFYDSKFFFLKFKRPGESQIKMHWNLPLNMATRLRELKEQASETAGGANQRGRTIRHLPTSNNKFAALMQEDQMCARTRQNCEVQINNMLVNQMNLNLRDLDLSVGDFRFTNQEDRSFKTKHIGYLAAITNF
ncbi:hypothetical protein C8R44DRAFT_724619 [Mycena epipterygia]|nr:hypothetical protein C8R44DRAFT_724619 [Mycena epipterygia]